MSSEARKIASRLNGARSKGPVTPEGKATVSQNAVTHGLTGKRIVLEGEDPAEFDKMSHDITSEFHPETWSERQLADDLAAARWRILRIRNIESSMMDLEYEHVGPAIRAAVDRPESILIIAAAWDSLQSKGNVSLERLHCHEARLQRIADRAETRLRAIRKEKAKNTNKPDQPSPQPVQAENQPAVAAAAAANEEVEAVPVPPPPPPPPDPRTEIHAVPAPTPAEAADSQEEEAADSQNKPCPTPPAPLELAPKSNANLGPWRRVLNLP